MLLQSLSQLKPPLDDFWIETLRGRVWGGDSQAEVRGHFFQTSDAVNLLLEIGSQVDRNVFATLLVPVEFSIHLFIDSPCEN